MAHAEKCPVCEDVGRVVQKITAEFDGSTVATTLAETTKECHGCGGKGWVEVSGDPDRYTVWTGAEDRKPEGEKYRVPWDSPEQEADWWRRVREIFGDAPDLPE